MDAEEESENSMNFILADDGIHSEREVCETLLRDNNEEWLCDELEWKSFWHLLSDELANLEGFDDWYSPDRYCILHTSPVRKGFAFLERVGGTGSTYMLIKFLLIDKDYRGQGYARALIAGMKEYFGRKHIHIHVNVCGGSKEFWEKMGFVPYDFNQDKFPNRMWLRTWDRKKLLTVMFYKEKNNS
jgi:GNAT superfamily N-acetyltransferase